MAKISVFYDFHDEAIKPFSMVVKFKPGEIDWEKTAMYIPFEAPFRRQMAEDFQDGTMGISVLIDDITVNPARIDQFGIHLPRIRERHSGMDLYDVEHLIIQMCDIEEVMQIDLQKYYDWR